MAPLILNGGNSTDIDWQDLANVHLNITIKQACDCEAVVDHVPNLTASGVPLFFSQLDDKEKKRGLAMWDLLYYYAMVFEYFVKSFSHVYGYPW